jgi:hypothetical protein
MSAQDQRGAPPPQVRLAEFRIIGPGRGGRAIPVHFNPETLEYTVTNNIKDQGNSTESKQQVSKSSGKLSMELVFDTTLDGADVREKTEKFQAMMKPVAEGNKKIAPVVEFAWGTYRFRGIFTSYKETLDYFSSTGVPLRASISIQMTQQDGLFAPTATGRDEAVVDAEAFEPAGDESEDDNTQRGPATGDPETDRGLAEDNDEDNPRFFSGRELTLPSGPDLQPPAAFASAGFGASFGASASLGLEAGIGVDVGFSAGVSAGIDIGLGIEAGIDVGLSAGFDVDIGIDIGVNVSADVRVGIDASLEANVDADLGGLARPRDDRGVVPGADPRPTTPGVRTDDARDAAGSGGFARGEFRRSGPEAPIRSRTRAPGSKHPGDDLFDELPLGPRFGGAASAGLPAALGAFAGLRPVPPRRRRPVLLSDLRSPRPERNLRTDTGASFEIGGQALDRSPSGLAADVGARASLADRISFDDPNGEGG